MLVDKREGDHRLRRWFDREEKWVSKQIRWREEPNEVSATTSSASVEKGEGKRKLHWGITSRDFLSSFYPAPRSLPLLLRDIQTDLSFFFKKRKGRTLAVARNFRSNFSFLRELWPQRDSNFSNKNGKTRRNIFILRATKGKLFSNRGHWEIVETTWSDKKIASWKKQCWSSFHGKECKDCFWLMWLLIITSVLRNFAGGPRHS